MELCITQKQHIQYVVAKLNHNRCCAHYFEYPAMYRQIQMIQWLALCLSISVARQTGIIAMIQALQGWMDRWIDAIVDTNNTPQDKIV